MSNIISEFFENREIFITGGSGTVGKALIEKLLRSCNVRRIYLLLRPKKNYSLEERLKRLKSELNFRRLMTEKPTEFDDKVMAIPGDVELPQLGITGEYTKYLNNVSIIIHSAATIRFDETLRNAIKINVGGTHEVLKLAENMKNLKILMHVSTFYSNPYLRYVEPKLYQSPMDWKFCLDLAQRRDVSDDMLNTLTRKLIIGFPNTYTFTKNLVESMVNDFRHKLPLAIFRPSIIVHAVEEPEPGFPTPLTGAMGLFVSMAAGVLKTIYLAPDQRLDLIPQDLVTKTLLYYTWKTSKLYEATKRPKEIPIYHTVSSTHNDITLTQYHEILDKFQIIEDLAFEKNFLIPGNVITDNSFVYMFMFFLKQLIPALLVDTILKLAGQKPVMLQIQRKLYLTLEVMRPFMCNNYDSDGISYHKEMDLCLHGTDFNVDVLRYSKSVFTSAGFTYDMIKKCREILLKEDPATIPRARIILKIKIALYRALQIYLAYKCTVGKSLLDKLLRSCNVGRIYLLLRPKKYATHTERLKKMKEDLIFRRLMSEKPNEFDEKVTIIPGDVELPQLGVTPEYMQKLENVSIIIHSAATVRFDEPLRQAIKLNVGGTYEVLKLAQNLKKLQAVIHVSTFYSNPYLEYTEPKVYQSPMDWKFCLDLCQRSDITDDMLDTLTRKLIIGFPNTYSFTKNLTESLVNDFRHELPLAIYRPSIVIQSVAEPEPGFPTGFVGAMAIFLAYAAGIMKGVPTTPDIRLDVAPQDLVVKHLLYYTMKTAMIYDDQRRPQDIPIYHTVSSTHSDITIKEHLELVKKFNIIYDSAFEKNVLIPGAIVTDNRALYKIVFFIQQFLPALLVDGILKMLGHKPQLMKIQRKLFTTVDVLKPFMFNNFDCSGTSYYKEMLEELNGTEFDVNIMRYFNNTYMHAGFINDLMLKSREVLLKEDPATIPRSRFILKM
ncbi:putative fatty acyl-CoA reductase CG8306 [Musca vetustissima]|uniref:putative fatty acyl-CoA reductase CG8306 n=1 Tax=Musca vetustissima TaxID=27455 RepID=UPI002AB67084|nr:putative fatty acyl-CoA reductase CG8306 [Musca vetustissima]